MAAKMVHSNRPPTTNPTGESALAAPPQPTHWPPAGVKPREQSAEIEKHLSRATVLNHLQKHTPSAQPPQRIPSRPLAHASKDPGRHLVKDREPHGKLMRNTTWASRKWRKPWSSHAAVRIQLRQATKRAATLRGALQKSTCEVQPLVFHLVCNREIETRAKTKPTKPKQTKPTHRRIPPEPSRSRHLIGPGPAHATLPPTHTHTHTHTQCTQ